MARLPALRATRLDRLIGEFSPRWQARRMLDRQAVDFLAAGGAYSSVRGRSGATSQWNPVDFGPNTALLPDLPELRSQSRELYRTSPLARGAINTVVTNTVDTGLQPRPVPNAAYLGLTPEAAAAWKVQALGEYWLWAGSPECDLERTLNFAEQQDLAMRATLSGGDSFLVKRFVERVGSPYGLKFQVLAADRVSNPNYAADKRGLSGGIETDIHGAPLACYVTRYHPGDLRLARASQQWDRVEVFGAQSGMRQVLHLFRKLEPEQLRGEPYLAPVVDLLKQLTTYTDAELQAAVVNSCFAIVSKTEGAQGVELEAAPAGQTDGKGQPVNISKAGQVVDLAPNESIESFSPERPSAAFDPFVEAMLRQIGVALELPFEVLIKHFTSSYSAARAALLEVWKFYRGRRAWLAARMCQPAYEALITEAVARGRLSAPGFFDDEGIRAAWLACEWHGPSPGNIDPLREAQALELQMRMRVKSLSEGITETTGGDITDTLAQIEADENDMHRRNIVQVWSGMQGQPDKPADQDNTDPDPARPGQGA